LGKNGDRECEQRKNHNRNRSLRQNRNEIRHRQRLPKQNAAIAAFAVEGFDGIEKPNHDYGAHDQIFSELVWLPK